MAVRRKTTNRRSLIRQCYICDKSFSTTADTPYMRQIVIDGRQITKYFCSEEHLRASYKYDPFVKRPKTDNRAPEQIKEKNKKYYRAHPKRERARRTLYFDENRKECNRASRFNHMKQFISRNDQLKNFYERLCQKEAAT